MKPVHFTAATLGLLVCAGYFAVKKTEPGKKQAAPAAPAAATVAEGTPPETTGRSGYYRSVGALDGAALKSALHTLIKGHRVLAYGEIWDALRDLDAGDEGRVVLIYQRTQRGARANGGNPGDWNREHLWPRAYGIGRSSVANTDLHHIRASDVGVNADRGHLYFDETDGEDYGGVKYSRDADSWEPPNEVKGDIARALFYMAVRYEGGRPYESDLELADDPDISKRTHGRLSVLLEWHRADPVSAEERARNEKIFRHYQGNRNPFIDHPEFVRRVFGR